MKHLANQALHVSESGPDSMAVRPCPFPALIWCVFLLGHGHEQGVVQAGRQVLPAQSVSEL